MKRFSGRSLLVLFVLLYAGSATAQWNNVAQGLVAGTKYGGAMQYRDGVVWAGGDDVYRSTNSGMTGQESGNFADANINDIVFFDKLHGLIATAVQVVFRTSDGGNSWQQVLTTQSIEQVGLHGSRSIMHARNFSGLFYTSMDGGANWTISNVGNNVDCRSF